MEYIKISDRKNWLLKEIPDYHPDTDKHTQWWRETKRKIIEGVWAEDFNEWRFMPPKLWWYINFGSIVEADSQITIKPLLADVVWEMAYMCLEARGFSGYKDDELRTGDSTIKNFSKSRTAISKLDTSLIYKPNGQFKDILTARELLRSRHSKPLGRPLYNNPCKNIILLGSRRGGKSKYLGVGEVLHEIVTDAAKQYTEESIYNPKRAQLFIGSAIASKSSETCESIRHAMEQLAINPKLGAWGEMSDSDYEPSPLYKDMMGDLKPNNMGNPYRHEYEEKINGRWVKGLGSKSSLKHGVYTTENPQVAAGGAYSIMFDEEVGLHDNVKVSHYSNEACMRVNTKKFGSCYYAGTAGNMDKFIESQEMFENPDEFNMLAYPNDWENSPNKKIGFFLPAYYTLYDYKDENGNTDIEAARAFCIAEQEAAKKGKSIDGYEGVLMNYPIYPSQMFIKKQGNIFPIPEIDETLRHLEYSEDYKYTTTPVKLKFDPKTISGVSYDPDVRGELEPLDQFPLSKNSSRREGAVVIYDFPVVDETGRVPIGLYIIGHDPTAKDDPNGDSLATIYVMKTNKYFAQYGHDEIVATYVGRPYNGLEEVNETLEKLAMFYGASPRMIWFENMVGETKTYFEKKKKLVLLATKPQLTLTNHHVSKSGPKLEYGFPMSNQYNKAEGCRYIRQWLLREHTKHEDGRVELNLNRIKDRALLQELKSFNMEDNFDRVMGLMGCIIGLEETHNQFLNLVEESRKPNSVINFFKRGADLLKGNDNNYYPTKTEIRDNTKKQTVEEGKHRFPMLSSK